MMGPSNELRELQQAETEAAIDDILSRWHHWRSGYRFEKGHSGGSGTSSYQCSRQYDDQNGALDDAIENDIMKAVDAVVENMAPSYQLMLQLQARALYVGVAVFNNPRLPQDKVVRAALATAARAELAIRLRLSGVLG